MDEMTFLGAGDSWSVNEMAFFGTGELLPVFQEFEHSFLRFLNEYATGDNRRHSLNLFITFQVSVIDVRFELPPWQLADKIPFDATLWNNLDISNDRSIFSYARGAINIPFKLSPDIEVQIPNVLKGDFPIHYTTNSGTIEHSTKCFDENSRLSLSVSTHEQFASPGKAHIYWKASGISHAARYCDYLPPNGFAGYLSNFNVGSVPQKSNKVLVITFGQAYKRQEIVIGPN